MGIFGSDNTNNMPVEDTQAQTSGVDGVLPAATDTPGAFMNPGSPATPSVGVSAQSTTGDTSQTSSQALTSATDLTALRQQALQQLSPLVGHLDQTPIEKFQTTMMMLQATDDQSLIKVAYEAAQEITDEKAKAQALLDIVNEINYFTQHKPT